MILINYYPVQGKNLNQELTFTSETFDGSSY